MLKPIGFWSYSTSDDEHSRGRLSQLRALLAAELQQKIGRSLKVNIFQDVAAIPPGTEWEKQIRDAINASFFLIPIITPALLQSEWCCREINLFRQREATSLRRNDLIFPLPYISIDDLDASRPEDCHDPEIFSFLRSRQWIDFRKLRLRNPESEDVAFKVEAMADAICAALRRAERNPVNEEPAARRQEPEKIEGRIKVDAKIIHGAPKGWLRPGAGKTEWFKDLDVGPEMVVVPAGEFMMGSPDDEPGRSVLEGPLHKVTFAQPFCVGRHAVTRGQFAAFVNETNYEMEGGAYVRTGEEWKLDPNGSWRNPGLRQDDSHPVVYVNWDDACAFVAWLSEATGHTYRLLSEAEWEYSARAGTRTPFWWGSSITPAQANYNGNYVYAGGARRVTGGNGRCPWTALRQIPGASTACTVMRGSGARISGTSPTTVPPRTVRLGFEAATAVSVSSAAGPGVTLRTSCARRIASGSASTGTLSWVSVSAARFLHPKSLAPHLLGSRGEAPVQLFCAAPIIGSPTAPARGSRRPAHPSADLCRPPIPVNRLHEKAGCPAPRRA